MHFAQLGAVVALVTTSSAFLIPSTISSADTNEVYKLPFDVAALTSERVVEVECPGCPIATTEHGRMSWRKAQSVLRLNFTIEHGDTDKLMINNLQVYPIDPANDRLSASFEADQLIKTPDGTWVYSSTQKLGYSIQMRHPFSEATESKNGLSLVSFNVEIIEVGYQFIRGISGVGIFIVETKNGQLMISETYINAPKASLPRPANSKHQECTTFLCKWKSILDAKTSSMRKGCGKGKGKGMPRPHGINGGPNKFPHHRPHKGSFNDDHPHRHRHHRGVIAMMLRSIFFHIIAPIAIGIVLGIFASMLGMVVGHLAIFTWRLLFRRGERGQYCRIKQDDATVASEEETKGFLEHQDAPPVYDDVVVVAAEKTEQK